MRVVGLLRGVNIGGRQLKMADLRAVVESLGHSDVETYLQSGNVVFTPRGRPGPALATAITEALRDAVGMEVKVLVRTGTQMADVVVANPYPVDDPTKVVVTFLASAGDGRLPAGFDLASYDPEHLTVHGTEIYLRLPFGQARSKLVVALAKLKSPGGDSATTRNWRTVEALARMSS